MPANTKEIRKEWFTEENLFQFWKRVNVLGEDDCWPWIGGFNDAGYGSFSIAPWKLFWQSHRMSYALAHGFLPKGWYVLHKCDNRQCVNPKHLYLGTHQDNMDDMVNRNRHTTVYLNGELCKHNKLTTEQVIKIISDVRPARVIAKEYGVGKSQVIRIRAGDTWKHILREPEYYI